VILAVGVLLVMGGLFALRFPVFLGDFDQWGFQMGGLRESRHCRDAEKIDKTRLPTLTKVRCVAEAC
jgi:hypothetical protein